MARKIWTDAERDQLRSLYPDTPMPELKRIFRASEPSIYNQAYQLGLKRSPDFLRTPESGRIMPGECPSPDTRFQKGHKTWNKGMKGLHIGGQETQFKPGSLNGAAAANLQPLGAERISKDGIRQRKILMDGPPQRRWKAVHCLLWEEHNGPVPDGHIVVFKDSDRNHIQIDNLEMITRSENMRRNTVHRYPEQLKQVMRTKAQLTRRVNKMRRNA